MNALKSSAVVIRRVSEMPDLRRASDLVLRVTGYRDVHPAVLRSILGTGGYVAAAFDEREEKCIGALYGLSGSRDGAPFLHSEMLAVAPEYRGQGIAYRLKLDQRYFAVERGMGFITWTFDPLRAVNAHLNIHRLGCEVVDYVEDMYGDLPGFSSDWPTDQLVLEWRVSGLDTDEDRHRPVDIASTPTLLDAVPVSPRLTAPKPLPFEEGEEWLVAIPPAIELIRHEDMELALEWRVAVRDALTALLGRGYHVEDFVATNTPAGRCGYVLRAERAGTETEACSGS